MAEIKIKTAEGGQLYEPKELKKLKELFTSILFYLSILIFIISFQFSDTMLGGWTQQFMPNLNGMPISDIFFLDSLTGWAVTGDGLPNDSNYILKTTNSGDNWTVKYTAYRDFFKIKFLNQNTGFVCGGLNTIGGGLFKSTNGGENWTQINAPFIIRISDISVLSVDTMWVVDYDGLEGGVFFTSDSGANWTQQLSAGAQNPDRIYMFNERIGFISKLGSYLKKTTNGGINWDSISGATHFRDIYFLDSLNGWKTDQSMQITTNGGINWITQQLPTGGNIILNQMLKFSNVNKDTIWGVGGVLIVGSGGRGIIFKTTNGGTNWGFQLPDTNINIFQYTHNKFVNKLNGWAYSTNTGVHTTTGGGDTTYLGIKQTSANIPEVFSLKQNFPNPFNPSTIIRFQIKSNVKSEKSNVKMVVYNIQGKEVAVLADGEYKAGSYELTFDGSDYSSGIYFYSLIVNGTLIDTKKMVSLK